MLKLSGANLFGSLIWKPEIIFGIPKYDFSVETRLMDLIMDEEQLDATKVQAAQRDIERRRKAELYEQKNKEAENSRLARNLRALERNNQTQKIKKGRRLMKRSMNMQPKKPLAAISTEHFKDLMELSEEDSSYFFM